MRLYCLSGCFGTFTFIAPSFAHAYSHAKKLANGGQIVIVDMGRCDS